MRLGPCKTGLSPPVILYYGSFKGDIYVAFLIVLCFGVELLSCLNLMDVFIFKLSSGNCVTAYLEIAAHSAYYMFFLYKYLFQVPHRDLIYIISRLTFGCISRVLEGSLTASTSSAIN